MKIQYVPLEKRSKREQREYYASKRGSWGAINPVTRKPPNPKAYIRKKSVQRFEHEPHARTFLLLTYVKHRLKIGVFFSKGTGRRFVRRLPVP